MPARLTYFRHAAGTTGVSDHWPGIDLVYWLQEDARRTQLDGAAVIRLVNTPRWSSAPEPDRLRIPEGFGPSGGGAGIGPFDIMFDASNKELWVDGKRFLSMQAMNVALLTDVSGSLQVVGTDLIREDLGGPVPEMFADDAPEQVTEEYLQWMASVRLRLCELLQSSPAAHAFLYAASP